MLYTHRRRLRLFYICFLFLFPSTDVHDYPEDAAMAIEVISRSMSQFVENEEIQISACRALERCDVRGERLIRDVTGCFKNKGRATTAVSGL